MSRGPEKELEDFLAPLPAWMRRTIQEGFSSLTQAEILESVNNSEEVFRLTAKYQRILQQMPARWREYRKRLKHEARMFDQYLVPKGKPGAPRKDDLAQEAQLLQRRGMKFPQIAGELNKKLGEDNKTTADAVRKLLKRRSQPDKT